MRSLLLLPSLLFLSSGCILAPLSNNVTARSLGKGKWGTNLGFVPTIPSGHVSQSYGLTKNLDVGAVGEAGLTNSLGLWTQYSIINKPEGFSLAGVGGAGFGFPQEREFEEQVDGDSVHGYVGAVASYTWKSIEPYFVARANFVTLSAELTPDIAEDIGVAGEISGDFFYSSYALGATYWVNQVVGVNFSMNLLWIGEAGFSHTYPLIGLVVRW